MNYEDRPRKVHLYHDQKGATFGLKNTPFANTLCKMNSNVPESHITSDPDKVTCKICRKDHRFAELVRKRNINEAYGKMAATDSAGVHMQMFGRALRPSMVNGMRTRHRRNWRGKLILQVCDTKIANYDPSDPYDTGAAAVEVEHWRDATLADMGGGVV